MTYMGRKMGPGPLVKCEACGSNHYAAVLHRCSKKVGDQLRDSLVRSFNDLVLELDSTPKLTPPREASRSNSVRFVVGDRVEVWNTKEDHQYEADHVPARRRNKGKAGEVVAVHDSHGLCYDLKFEDGSLATYSDTEVRRSPPPPAFFVRAGTRQSGKTMALVKRSARTGEVILCANPAMAMRVVELAAKMRLTIPTPRTHGDLTAGRLTGTSNKLLIDDLDLLLKTVMPQVNGFTISLPDADAS